MYNSWTQDHSGSDIGYCLLSGTPVLIVSMGRGFTSKGQELGSVFSAVVCNIQASKHYIESLQLVLKDKKKANSLKVKGPLYSCLLIACLPFGRTLN